ncbi:MAG: efflux transporter periplasmic adaptor subunit [Sulfurovum sp.]|nr:MAG: efflux transporter periplasmic adaptor subunit [Sulfurovum sp.]
MNKTLISTVGITLAVGMGLGYGVSLLQMQSPSEANASAQTKKEGKKILFYRNAMNPAVTSPVPTKDSMGMDYVPVYADGEASDDKAGTVKIDPTVVQNIGVRTVMVKVEALSKTIRAVGRVDFDEEKMARLHPKTEGWIDEVFIDKTGERVKEDDILMSIYSPQLVSTQEEYLLALQNVKALSKSPFKDVREGAKRLVQSAKERLKLLDVPAHQIRELEVSRKIKKNLHIHTPVAGTILRIGARKGQHVSPKTELYMIADLRTVWIIAEIYEYELPWLKEGDSAEVTLISVPGKVFKGTVDYIYPYAEAKTRTTKVRLVFKNENLLLRPDMFAEVKISVQKQKNALVIPSEAIIRSGDNTHVFVVKAKGKYEPRFVQIGIESSGKVSILSGLKEGEEVVTSAQFLIDSESKLREAMSKMTEVLPMEETMKVDKAMKMDKNITKENAK